jgi:two-component system alkaline phosphatase synthesis response regulator PhoP
MSSFTEVVCVKGTNSQFDQLISVIEAENLSVRCIEKVQEVIPYVEKRKPALILLDLILDRKDAIDLLKELEQVSIRRYSSVVVLSERKENYVHITALNSGADDFLVKPVNKRVFASRLRSWMRKHAAHQGLSAFSGNGGEVVLDEEKFVLVVKGNEISLQRKEFEIISLLASKPKKVFSREEIIELVWGEGSDVRYRTIDVHIRNLRGKIGRKYIKTYKGIGYSFDSIS